MAKILSEVPAQAHPPVCMHSCENSLITMSQSPPLYIKADNINFLALLGDLDKTVP